MKRLVIAALLVLAVSVGVFYLWMRSGGGAVVELSDSQMEEARQSGQGAKEIAVETASGADQLPSLEDLKVIVDRTELNRVAEVVTKARGDAAGDDRWLITSLLAEVERLRGNVDEASQLALEAAEALPTNSRVRLIYANTIRSMIVKETAGGGPLAVFGQLGATKQYKAELQAAIELDPANVDARVAQILVLAFLPSPIGDRARAEELIEELGKHDQLRMKFWRAQLLSAAKKEDEALDAFRKLRSEHPEDLDVQFTIGDLLYKREDWKGAAAVFDGLMTEPWTQQGYNALYQSAKCREKAEYELEEALAMLQQFEAADPVGELMPGMDRVKYHQALVLRKMGRLEEALAMFRAAAELNPKEKRFKNGVDETIALIEAGGQ